MEEVDKVKHQNKKAMKKILNENPTISKNKLKMLSGDPVIAKCHPLKYFGAISEIMDDKLSHYLKHDVMNKIIEQ